MPDRAPDFEALAGLNDAQRDAVIARDGINIIFAGAGTGKTKTLVHKIAYMIESGVPEYAILALTFTNKAAREMRERISAFFGREVRCGFVGTFHAFGMKTISIYGHTIGIDRNKVTIVDDRDQEKVIEHLRRIISDRIGAGEFNLPEAVGGAIDIREFQKFLEGKKFARHMAREIDRLKNEGIFDFSPEAAGPKGFDLERLFAYEYQKYLNEKNLFDFGDMLIMPMKIIAGAPEVGESLKRIYRYILVDEFQDTNIAQYRLLKLLTSENLSVVGDDNQSIYGFRGAHPENIELLKQEYPGSKVIKLEKNYRSTNAILSVANTIASGFQHTERRTLYSDHGRGEQVRVKLCRDKFHIARSIVDEVVSSVKKHGVAPHQIAILYRANYQSVDIEREMRTRGIRYFVFGSQSFFRRAEIADALSYFFFAVNPNNPVAFERSVGAPKRGIGETTVASIVSASTAGNITVYEAAKRVAGKGRLKKNWEYTGYLDTIGSLIEMVAEKKPLSEIVTAVVHDTGLFEWYSDEYLDDFTSRADNLTTLLEDAASFDDRGENAITDFMEYVSLMGDEDRESSSLESVRLSTVHKAKGLEFDTVLVAGVTPGLMPMRIKEADLETMSSFEIEKHYEEERRVFYVAVTRPKRRLIIYGSPDFDGEMSPFIDELTGEGRGCE